jgi:hypothetical protein
VFVAAIVLLFVTLLALWRGSTSYTWWRAAC